MGLRASAAAGPTDAAGPTAGPELPGIVTHVVKNDVAIVWELTFVRLDGIKYNAGEQKRCVRPVPVRVGVLCKVA